MKIKKRIFEIIQLGNKSDFTSNLFDLGFVLMVFTNLFITIFETFDCSEPYLPVLNVIELITIIFFTVEYILRLWTAELLFPNIQPARATVRYMFSFIGLIDLLSFLPFYLPIATGTGIIAFRMFRIIRIFRLFRINAYYDALNVIGDVIYSKRDELLSSIFIIGIMMIAASVGMYNLEHDVQPDVFSNAFSGLWWSVSTLLTVGYGDIYPITDAGRFFGTIITFLGVGMVAIPTGILSAGFVEQYTRVKSLDDYSAENDVRFISLNIGENHPWRGMKIKELNLPPDLILAVIQRKGETVIPRGDTVIYLHDRIVLGAEGYSDDLKIKLKEVILKPNHPWNGQAIRDLDISRQTIIVMVRRDDKVLIPTGSLVLLCGDIVILYSKKIISNSSELVI